jgi:hypothetical protein
MLLLLLTHTRIPIQTQAFHHMVFKKKLEMFEPPAKQHVWKSGL